MSTLDALGFPIAPAAAPAAPAAADPAAAARPQGAPEGGAHVELRPAPVSSISSMGRALSSASAPAGGSDDIEDSGLPDTIKSMLRHIRELRRMLEKLVEELQRIQADPRMRPEARQARVQQLQAQISTINGALISAMHKLSGLMARLGLDDDQKMAASRLALK